MKRRVLTLLMTAALCLLLALPAFAAEAAPTGSPYIRPTAIIVCLVIGFLIALIPMGVLKGQIRNVHSKTEAEDYTSKGSFDLQIKDERFLRTDVTKVPIPKNNPNDRR